MKFLMILNDPLYGTERVYNGLRLATNPSRQERQRRTHACQRHAQGCNRAGVRNLHGCPGLTDTELVEGAVRSTLDELTEMTVNADKVLVF